MAAAAISKQSAAPISKARRPKRGAASPFGYQRATTKTFIRNSIGQWANLPRDDAAVIDPAVPLCHTKTNGPWPNPCAALSAGGHGCHLPSRQRITATDQQFGWFFIPMSVGLPAPVPVEGGECGAKIIFGQEKRRRLRAFKHYTFQL
jgi:hypothetical protein